MKEKFEQVFDKLKELSVDQSVLCKDFWLKIMRLKQDFNEADCWKLLFENIEWVVNKNVISTTQIMEWFSPEELQKNGFYTQGKHKVVDRKVIALGTAEIEASGHSRVILFDQATCEAYDTTFVTAFHNSKAHVYGCVANGFNDARINVNSFGLVEAWDYCNITANGKSVVKKHDNVVVSSTPGVTIM